MTASGTAGVAAAGVATGAVAAGVTASTGTAGVAAAGVAALLPSPWLAAAGESAVEGHGHVAVGDTVAGVSAIGASTCASTASPVATGLAPLPSMM